MISITKKCCFKPTKTAVRQFRVEEAGALSYFIAGNDEYPEDKGFALQPWTNVRFENAAVILEDKRAIAMGNYFFTDLNGNETKVEYTFGYAKKKMEFLRSTYIIHRYPFNPDA